MSGVIFCCLYSIAWGWHKVLLPSVDKAANIAKADKIHTILRVLTLCSCGGFGILAAFVLPDEYKETGVFNGTFHAINRLFMFIAAAGLLKFIVDMGNNIKNALKAGASKPQVAPAPTEVEKPADKKPAVKTDADKIGGMVKAVIKVMIVVQLYLLYDIAISAGKVRHIEPPLCGAKNLFVRIPSIVQLFVLAAVTYVFPVKKPDNKGKTGMQGTTVTTTSSSA